MSSPASSANRILLLDPLRFLAAFGVLIYHLTYRAPEVDLLGGQFFSELHGWTRYLNLAVPFFFMISGFVIAISGEGKTAGQFLWSRFVRLFPAYWVCVIITFIVGTVCWRPHYEITPGQALVNLTMLQSYLHVPNVDAPYWTLGEELRFYLIFSALLLLRQTHRLVLFGFIWAGLSLLDIYVHLPLLRYEMTLQHAPFFIAGIAYYALYRQGIKPAPLLLALFSLLLGIKRFAMFSAIDFHSKGDIVYCSPVVFGTIITVFHVIFFLIVTHRLRLAGPVPLFAVLGGLSYPFYLIHNTIGITVMISLENRMNRWWSLGVTCVATVTVAFAIWRYWEQPVSSWLRRWARARQGTSTPSLPRPMAG